MKYLPIAFLMASAIATPAAAVTQVYMTGTQAPWGIEAKDNGSPEFAMDLALGNKSWTSIMGLTTSAFAGASFVYIEGGDSSGLAEFLLSGGRSAIESFVKAGGSVLLNAARNDTYGPIDAGFGLTLTGARFSDTGKLTKAGETAGLDARGAGKSWSGTSFSHDVVSCEQAICGGAINLIEGTEGSTLMAGAFGDGYFMVGGMTAPYWQSENGKKLRANMISFAAEQGSVVAGGVVPEPASWALMIAGFGMVGATVRRRRLQPLSSLS